MASRGLIGTIMYIREEKKGFMNKYPHVNRWIRLAQWFQARGGKGAGRGVGALTWQKLQELE